MYKKPETSYKMIDLDLVPDCCLSCAYGDWDGEGCYVLADNGFGLNVRSIDDGFVDGFFHLCDNYVRAKWTANKISGG